LRHHRLFGLDVLFRRRLGRLLRRHGGGEQDGAEQGGGEAARQVQNFLSICTSSA
jgi:hypothetical protein